MRFKKISVTKRGVTLTRESKDVNGATEEISLETPERPKPEFNDLLQAFKSFLVGLLEDVITFADEGQVTITTLNLSEDKNGNRGLIVTGIIPVPDAYDKPLVLNTPLVREGNAELELDEAATLDEEVLDLIRLVEAEAEKFVNGNRLPPSADAEKKKPSENSKEFDERAASASVKSTRKPQSEKKTVAETKRKGKGKGKPGADANDNVVKFPKVNEARIEIADSATIRQLLLSVERDVPVEAINAWSLGDRAAAMNWATARQKELLGQADAKVPAEPECVIRAATLPIKAADWDEGAPIPISKEAAETVQAAAQG